MAIQTAIEIWHDSAIPKAEIPVFPPNPRLAKLSIAAVELIDDVDVHHGRGAGLRCENECGKIPMTYEDDG